MEKGKYSINHLDFILRFLRDIKKGAWLKPNKELPQFDKFKTYDWRETSMLVKILIDDKYVDKIDGLGRDAYYVKINSKGINFINSGGYTSSLEDKKNRQSKINIKAENINIRERWTFKKIVMTIVLGIVVWLITKFILLPLFEQNSSEKNTEITEPENQIQKDTVQKKESTLEMESNDNIYYLQSYTTLELFNGDLILTQNDIIEFINQKIPLKIVDKKSRESIIENKFVGDVIYFKNYTITLLDLNRNISSYDLKIKVELDSIISDN